MIGAKYKIIRISESAHSFSIFIPKQDVGNTCIK